MKSPVNVTADGDATNAKDPHREVGVFQEIPAATYSPREEPPSTIGAGGLDCCVRNGNRYISTAITTGNCALDLFRDQNGVWLIPPLFERPRTSTNIKPPSPRPISTGQLNALLHLHFRPINVVVWPRALPG